LKAGAVAQVPTKRFPSNAIPSGKNSRWNRCRCSSDACTHKSAARGRTSSANAQDALYVEFFQLAGVTVDPGGREFLAQFLRVAVVRLDVNRVFEQERLVGSRQPISTI